MMLEEFDTKKHSEGSMGAWAMAAWDNDGAADWFGEMFPGHGHGPDLRRVIRTS